jgi:hypothetical protein
MSTPQNNSLIHTPRLANVLAAAGVIIAVAVSALFLTLNGGANHTAFPTSTPHTQTMSSPYLPTIHIPGAGVAHLVADPETGQAHGTVTPSQ